LLRFDNGSFVSITEGKENIGSMSASITSGPVPTSTIIIPSKKESLFLKLMSEQISSIIQGINIVSAFLPQEIDSNTAKILMTKVMEMIRNDR
jgi:hypothetical protein